MIQYELPKGTIYVGKTYKVKMSKDSFLNRINELNYLYQFKYDSISNDPYYRHFGYYQIDSIVIKEKGLPFDTIKNIKFKLREINENKTKVEVINVELKNPGNIQNWKYLRHLNRFYKSQIKKDFLNKIEKN